MKCTSAEAVKLLKKLTDEQNTIDETFDELKSVFSKLWI